MLAATCCCGRPIRKTDHASVCACVVLASWSTRRVYLANVNDNVDSTKLLRCSGYRAAQGSASALLCYEVRVSIYRSLSESIER